MIRDMLRLMTETSETQPVEAAEILRVLRDIRDQVRSNSERLDSLRADITGALRELQALNIGDDLSALHEKVNSISEVVERAAPLLNSGPARALAGGGLLSVVRRTRPGTDG